MKHYSIMDKSCCALVICLIMSSASYAQFPTYYVHLVKGDCMVKKPGKKAAAIKQKDLIYSDDIIEIRKDHAEIHLVDKEGYFLVVNKKGKHKAADLTMLPVKKTHGVTQKYLHFLWEDLFEPDLNRKMLNDENLAGTWGGVSRGRGSCDLALYPSKGEYVSADTVAFRWQQAKAGELYNFILYDDQGKELMNFILSDTTLIALTRPLKNEVKTMYLVVIQPVQERCNAPIKTHFYLLAEADEKKLIDSLVKSVPIEQPMLYNLAVADALGSNGFISEAKKYLSKALTMSKSD